MTYESIANRNISEGLHVMFVYANDVTGGLFFRLFLFVVFMIVCMGTYFGQKRLSGQARFSVSFAGAGLFTSLIAILAVSTIPGLNDVLAVVICIAVATIGLLFLMIDED